MSGVSSLPKKGYPGRAIVFGLDSAVITIGDKVNDILIAAGKLGTGRVLMITHNSYMDNFAAGTNSDSNIKTLHQNIKMWITKNNYAQASDLMEAETYIKTTTASELKKVKAVYYT